MDAQDVGLKMSIPGVDVNSAADANTYFSSSWPWLKIGLTDVVQATSGPIIIPHSYQYPPFTLVWSSLNGLAPLQLSITSTAVTISTTPGEILRYYIFRLPINVAYDSRSLLTTPDPQQFIDHDFGIKFAKQGRDVNSPDYRDFTIHSGTRSPLLHKVVYAALAPIVGGTYNGVQGLKWSNDLPYFPTYFPFFSADGNTWTVPSSMAQTAPKINYDGVDTKNVQAIVLNYLSHTGGFGSFVVLKDPFDSPTVYRTTI